MMFDRDRLQKGFKQFVEIVLSVLIKVWGWIIKGSKRLIETSSDYHFENVRNSGVRFVRRILGLGILATLLAVFLSIGYFAVSDFGFSDYESPTGEFVRGKTLWDWLQLLIIPIALAGAGLVINTQIRESERKRTEDQVRESALQNYFDKLSELLLSPADTDDLQATTETIIKARTINILRVLDSKRNQLVLNFLQELVQKNRLTINLKNADLSDAQMQFTNLENVDLEGANLTGTNLEGAILANVNFKEATLTRAILEKAYMEEVILKNANLTAANLRQATLISGDLTLAKLSSTDFRGTNLEGTTLSGATIDDNTKFDTRTTLPDNNLYKVRSDIEPFIQ